MVRRRKEGMVSVVVQGRKAGSRNRRDSRWRAELNQMDPRIDEESGMMCM